MDLLLEWKYDILDTNPRVSAEQKDILQAKKVRVDLGQLRGSYVCSFWKKYSKATTVRKDAVILHSRADDVVPFGDSEELARISGAKLIEVGTDHRLADQESLERMLEECRSAK